jgi:hypothetical protein
LPLDQAAIRSSFSALRITILSASSGKAHSNAFALYPGARIHTSRSSSLVKITGMTFAWVGSKPDERQ